MVDICPFSPLSSLFVYRLHLVIRSVRRLSCSSFDRRSSRRKCCPLATSASLISRLKLLILTVSWLVSALLSGNHHPTVALGLISTLQLSLLPLLLALRVFFPSHSDPCSCSIFSLHHLSSFIEPPLDTGLPRPARICGEAKVIFTGTAFSFGVSGFDKLWTEVETVGERSSSTWSKSSSSGVLVDFERFHAFE